MDYEWDEVKARSNLEKHGVPFEAVHAFEWDTALVLEDDREDYGEARYRAMGLIRKRLHSLVFTLRGENIRVIGIRKANRREVRFYDSYAR